MDQLYPYVKYHGYRWLGIAKSQDISSRGTYLISLEYSMSAQKDLTLILGSQRRTKFTHNVNILFWCVDCLTITQDVFVLLLWLLCIYFSKPYWLLTLVKDASAKRVFTVWVRVAFPGLSAAAWLRRTTKRTTWRLVIHRWFSTRLQYLHC